MVDSLCKSDDRKPHSHELIVLFTVHVDGVGEPCRASGARLMYCIFLRLATVVCLILRIVSDMPGRAWLVTFLLLQWAPQVGSVARYEANCY